MIYLICGIVVLFFSAIMSMAGLGAAFIFVPLFYWLGIPLEVAMPTALLLNTISLAFASISYVRSRLVDFRAAVPMIITSVLLSPLGAYSSQYVAGNLLLWLFTAFLFFAGCMMLFYRPPARVQVAAGAGSNGCPVPAVSGTADTKAVTEQETAAAYQKDATVSTGSARLMGSGVGALAGFMGGLLGVGGGNFIVPFLNWLGFTPKVAAATTAFVVVFASLAGFMGHISIGHIDLLLLAVTGAAAVAGALIGSWIMKYKVTGPQLKKIIGMLLFVMAVKIAWGLILNTS